jgi:hypothetical protein
MITNKQISQREVALAKARKVGARESAAFDVASLVISPAADFRHRLRAMEQQLKNLNFEVAVVYSVEGDERCRVKGLYDSLDLSAHEELIQGGILTHNHPDGGFFSLNDVTLAHKVDLTELRAVRKDKPSQVVSMSRPDSGWNLTAYEELMKAETIRWRQAEALQYTRKLGELWTDEKAMAYATEWGRQEWIALFPVLLTRLGLTWVTRSI